MKKDNTRLVFRADGTSTIGLGHLYRSLAMVQMLKDDFECLFVIHESSLQSGIDIGKLCNLVVISYESLQQELIELKKIVRSGDIVILDGYRFDLAYQQFIKCLCKKLVMIDDLADQSYIADMIINQGGQSMREKYPEQSDSQLLLGLDYILVRPEFLDAARSAKASYNMASVFICLGGSDPYNITNKVLKACVLSKLVDKVVIATGGAFRHGIELGSIISSFSRSKDIELLQNISASIMVESIAKCGIGISTASSIALEICCVKSGLICGTVVRNQEELMTRLLASSCCVSVGDFRKASIRKIQNALNRLHEPMIIQKVVEQQSKVIDGLSGHRILQKFKTLADA